MSDRRSARMRLARCAPAALLLLTAGCGGSDGAGTSGQSTAQTSTSPAVQRVVDSSASAASTTGTKRIIPAATSVQCRASLEALNTAAEFFRASQGREPASIGELIDQGLAALPDGALLDGPRSVLSVTTGAITYTFTYDPVTDQVVVASIQTGMDERPGCP